jgi:hypothetical protein
MSTKINTQVIVTETIICDVCHCEANYNKPLLSAGQLYLDDGQQVNYGMNLCLNVYGKQVEHICPDCLRKVLDALRKAV